MASPIDLLNQYAGNGNVSQPASPESFIPNIAPDSSTGVPAQTMNAVAGVSSQKQDDVANAAVGKVAAFGQPDYYSAQVGKQTGAGAATATGLEADIRNLDPLSLMLKYGTTDANKIIAGQALAETQTRNDAVNPRSTGEMLGDSALGVGQGLANGLGGIAAFGLGMVDEGAGQWASSKIQSLNDGITGLESDSLNARRRLNQTENTLDYRDNTAQYQKDIGNDGNFMAGLKRIGRDAIDAVSNATDSGQIVADGISQGVGSILAAGPLGKAIKAGSEAIPALSRLATAERSTAAGIGLMEGGGAYQQNSAEVSGMSFADLTKNSPDFVQMTKPVSQGGQGMSQEDARTSLAHSAGLQAALIQGPAAALTGRIASGFEAHPFAVSSLRQLGQNTLKEGVEETLQSATGQTAQNIGLQNTVDPNLDLTKGVGEQAGLGGLYGMGAAGALQAAGKTGSVLSTGSMAAINAAKASKTLIQRRQDAVTQANEQASPVADSVIAQAAAEAQQNAPQAAQEATSAVSESALPDDQKAATNDYINALADTFNFNAEEEAPQMPEAAGRAVQGATNRVQALQQMATFMTDPKNSQQDRMNVMQVLNAYLGQLDAFIQTSPEALDDLPADHPAVQFANGVGDVIANVTNTPSVRRAGKVMDNLVNTAESSGLVQPVTDENIATPEGQQNAQNHIAIAEYAPEKANVDAVDQILKHAQTGQIQLNDTQRAALQTAAALLNSAKAYDAEAAAQGMQPQDVVSAQIKTDETRSAEGTKSALQHAKGIRSAYMAGNLELARNLLVDLQQFAQHMQNKVGALNTHLVTADPNTNSTVNYDALMPDRTWATSRKGLFVNPQNARSVALAKQVGLEAQFVTNMANSLGTAFPELGVRHLENTPLNPLLVQGTPSEIAKAFRDGTRKVDKSVNQSNDSEVVNTSPTPLSDDQISAMSDAELNEQMDAAHDRLRTDGFDAVTNDNFSRMSDEMTNREEAVVTEQDKAENTETTKTAPKEEVTKPEPVKEAVTEPTTVAEVYPSLVQPVAGNKFHEAFKLPKTEKSRISKVSNGFALVSNMIKGNAVAGYDMPRATTQAYGTFLNGARAIAVQMQNQLDTWANKKGKSDLTAGQAFLSGKTKANTYLAGKLLNLTEASADGKISYNPALLQNAILAAMQWTLVANNYTTATDVEGAAKFFGIDESAVTDDMVDLLNSGLSQVEAVSSLAQKIQQYWGVSENNDAPLGYTKGIPLAMAGEIIEAMTDPSVGIFQIQKGRYDIGMGRLLDDGEKSSGAGVKEINRIVAGNPTDQSKFPVELLASDSPVHAAPDAIERSVMVEPEETFHFGGNTLPVTGTQLNNASVQLTAQQKATVKNAQDQPFYFHMPMVNFLTQLGRDNVVDVYGEGDLSSREELLNKNYLETLKGRNLSITAAYDQLQNIVGAATLHSNQNGIPLDQVEHRYAYAMTRVNRLQMLGKQNPQSSKLMREAILPTWSTLDMNQKENRDAFMVAAAQMMDIKIHNQDRDSSVAQVQELFNNQFADSVQAMRDFHESGTLSDDITATLLSDNGGRKLSAMKMQALLEYARLDQATPEERTAFKTPMYVEADGMTNGVINAIALMTTGPFTQNEMDNLGRGGVVIGGDATTTANELRSRGDQVSRDMYQATTDVLSQNISSLRKSLTGDLLKQSSSLQWLMGEFNDDINTDKSGNITDMKRGIAKNPLTITLYGSGSAGIAGKMTKAIADSIYQRMSLAAEAMDQDPNLTLADAMFPGDPAKMAFFQRALSNLTERVAVQKGNKPMTLNERVTQPNPMKSIQEFTLGRDELKNIRDNMETLFVAPMNNAIRTVVGDSVLQSATLVRMATQAQSIVLQDAYMKAVQARLDEKGNVGTEFLSQNDLNEIQKGLVKLAPFIQTGTQNFYVAGSQSSEVANTDFSRTFSDKLRMPATVDAPSDSGVSGIPFINIGMGDGQMVQNTATSPKAPKNNLYVFDGMNMALDRLSQDSTTVNQGVFDSWMNNPIRVVKDSFDQMMKHVADNMPEASRVAFVRSISPEFISEEDAASISNAGIMNMLQELQATLDYSADIIDARHSVLDNHNISVDQMAAVGSPYVVGDKTAVPTTNAEKLDALNKNLAVRLENKRAPVKRTFKPATVEQAKQVETVAAKTPSGAKLMTRYALTNLFRTGTDTQKKMFNFLMRNVGPQNFKVVTGTPEQLIQWNKDNGSELKSEYFNDPSVNGFYSPLDGVIYLVNASPEVVLHEMIHSATMDNLFAHYSGQDMGPLSGVIDEAVERLEESMNQFMQMDKSEMTRDQQRAYNDAYNSISEYIMQDTAKAKTYALNEFMAWTLANQNLETVTRNTPASFLVRIAKDAVRWIKQLAFGRKRFPEQPGEDLFSNVSFNTAVFVRSMPTTLSTHQDTVLMHNSQYGNNPRLQEVIEGFDKTVAQYLNDAPDVLTRAKRDNELNNALMSVVRLQGSVNAHGFPMSMQEGTAYSAMVGALMTQAKIDPASMSRAQELYAHVTKTLKVEDLMNPDATDQDVERYYAQEKYNVLMGNYLTETDTAGRSSLLPSFLALATVNDGLREVLAKLPLPKLELNGDKTLDAVLENTGTRLINKLSNTMAGERGDSVQAAVDSLTGHILDIAQNRETFFDQYASKAGGFIDRANDYIVQAMDDLSSGLIDKAEKVKNKSNNKYVKALASSAKLIGAIATEKNGAHVADGVMTALNRSRGLQPWFDLVNDMVGRTESNAGVYDMIKAVHALVQQDRQQFRQHLPTVIADKFSRDLTEAEWTLLHKSLGKADLASLGQSLTNDEIHTLVSKPSEFKRAVKHLETQLKNADPDNFDLYQAKMQQLAGYMMNGEQGQNLLRNAEAISRLLGEKPAKGFKLKDKQFVAMVDQLTSLYALDKLNLKERYDLSTLVDNEAEGIDFAMAYLKGQQVEEKRKADKSSAAKFNQYKGYIPSENQQGVSLIVASDAEYDRLSKMSYVRVGDYKGSSAEGNRGKHGYYYAPVSGRAVFNQGIMQNIRQTVNGVDVNSGNTVHTMVAGRITDPTEIRNITKRMARGETGEHLLPVYNNKGTVIAYERSLAPQQTARLNKETNLAKMVGVWRGRQVEEIRAGAVNTALVDSLHRMYEKDMVNDPSNKAAYINIMDPRELAKDKVLSDAVSLFTPEVQEHIEDTFGKEFYVRRDMLADAFGYRDASIGDAWTGNSRWNKAALDTAKNVALAMFGNKAYQYATNAERFTQNLVHDARTMIIVKSIIVPVSNALGNVYQLISRGVPIADIARGLPRKLAEIDKYTKSRVRQIEAEAELRAANGDVVKTRKLKAEIQTILDSHSRMSIWPLIQAGEFSAINDASLAGEETALTSGKLYSYLEEKVDKLPKEVRDMGRYALITQDTALFKGLEKAMDYGDFISKAILFDHLTKRQQKTTEYALSRITEEYVNYDRLPGRFRGYMEKTGLLWFYNFKIRSAKVAMSMLRNNPVHALVGAMTPHPTLFGTIGSPITDNMFTVLGDGRMSYSLGIGQALQSPMLNPWVNILAH
ncbi:virion RNA polymerase [Erwinia phage Ea9-2]|uniref:Virion-associated RNA polymerase n=1 Tax=Erwinia phage Ea9-2 TaxID=1429767 RepID=W6ASR7_9CAUD|nr:virion RNA polymerase [Erwinia phage Ea9-2]AHI60130.1 virion-associated RNA polymerase [Erwinia phage Ea9-2]